MKKILTKILKFILKQLAKLTVLRFEPDVIAVTGSVGKTSAKEAIYAVLKGRFRVRKSSANLNNELGIPLAILSDWPDEELKLVSRDTPAGERKIKKTVFWVKVLWSALVHILFMRKSAYPEVLVLEYAADRPGDIKYLLEIARPYIGVVTTVGEIPVHVEFFSGPEAVAREKAKLVESLPAHGLAVLNFDNEIVMRMKERIRARVISFGFSEGADVRISNFENNFDSRSGFGGISFKLEYGGSFVPVIMKDSFGKARAYAAGIAACVGLFYDLNLVEISESPSEDYLPAKGRMNLVKGIKEGIFIINDAYNASPDSMREALETLAGLKASRKIAVLGDMLELGKYSIQAHESIGWLVPKSADILITVGARAKFIAESAKAAALGKDRIMSFDTVAEAGKVLYDLTKPGDLILIKASRAMEFEKIVEEISEPRSSSLV